MVPVVLRHNLRLLLGFDHMWLYYYCNSLFVCWHNTYSFGPRSSTLKRGKARVYLLKSIDPDLAHLMDKLSWDNGIKSSSRIFVKELVFVNELVFQWRLWTGLIETVLAAGAVRHFLPFLEAVYQNKNDFLKRIMFKNSSCYYNKKNSWTF